MFWFVCVESQFECNPRNCVVPERMAADSDGQTLQAVVICEGDLRDPEFPSKFRHLVGRLNKLLVEKPKSRKLKVNKVSFVFHDYYCD